MNEPSNRFRKIVGRVAAVVVLIHCCLLAISLLLPKKWVGGNPFTDLYAKIFVIGPFFPESRIKSSYHLFVSTKRDAKWGPGRDYGDDAFRRYCAYPWRYDWLRAGDLEKAMAWRVASIRNYGSKSQPIRVARLRNYVSRELLRSNVPDSIRMDYIRRTYVPKNNSYRSDTLFTDNFYPTDDLE